jgi:hypothetical protein
LNRGSTATLGMSILVGLVGLQTIRFDFLADMATSLLLITSLWTDCLVSYCAIRLGIDEEGSEIVKWAMAKIGKFPALFGPTALMTPFCFFIPWPLAVLAALWRLSCAFSWPLPYLLGKCSGLANSLRRSLKMNLQCLPI